MEIIQIPGYTEDEKLNIARQFLVPKQLKENGLKPEQVAMADDAILEIIRLHTKEAGVRNLERQIGGVCRKLAREVVQVRRVPSRSSRITLKTISACLTTTAWLTPKTKWASPPAWPGPRWAARPWQ